MKVSILGSGSSGNSTFIETDNFRFLIDAGFSGKQTKEKLEEIGVAPDTLGAILITHEHGDHILGAGILSRKYDIPIYITKKSYDKACKKLGKIDEKNIKFIEENFVIGGKIEVEAFEVMHDAQMTVAFCVRNSEEKKLAIATDIGYTTNIVKQKFMESDIVIIESNYDYKMLMNGPYPWELKNRVKGKRGHLSNLDSAKFIKTIHSEKLKKVFLAHMSKDNNTAEIAYNTVKEYLRESSLDIELEVARQDKVTEIFKI